MLSKVKAFKVKDNVNLYQTLEGIPNEIIGLKTNSPVDNSPGKDESV